MNKTTWTAVVAILLAVMTGPAMADDDDKVLYFNPKLVAGLGPTFGKTYHETGNTEFHLSGGVTLLSLDRKGHIGFLGIGTAVNIYAFSLHPELRTLADADAGYWVPTGYVNVVGTVIPVRIGPLAYQFSWNGHVRALGVDRGRLHLVTLDVAGLIRLIRDKDL